MARMPLLSLRIKHRLLLVIELALLLMAGAVFLAYRQLQDEQAAVFQSARVSIIARLTAMQTEGGLSSGNASEAGAILERLREIEEVRFAAICDLSGHRLVEYKEEYAAPYYESIQELVLSFKTKPAAEKSPSGDELSAMSASDIRSFEGRSESIVAVPVSVGAGGQGIIVIGVDRTDIEDAAAENLLWLLAAGISILVLGSLGVYFSVSRILNPLNEVKTALQRILRGDTDVKIDVRRSDEIGEIGESIKELAEYLKNAFDSAEKIRQGVMGVSNGSQTGSIDFTEIPTAFNGAVNEALRLIRSAVDGHFGARGDTEKFQGIFRDLIRAMNQLMDSILLPINEVSETLEAVAEDNLRIRIHGDYKGDFERLKEAVNGALQYMEDRLTQVASSAGEVASGSNSLYCISQLFATCAAEQSTTLKSVTGNLENMSEIIQKNSENTQQGIELAAKARESSEKGFESMKRLSSAIAKMKASSDSTAKIVKTIDEIAFQTNLLSLNAAVEAARAGESGKGFAIVAEEVRNLAMRSADAARHSAEMIEQSVRDAETGVAMNQEAMQNLEEIKSHADLVSKVMSDIASSSERQLTGVESAALALKQLESMIQQYVVNSNQSIVESEILTKQTEILHNLVGSFSLSSDNVPDGGGMESDSGTPSIRPDQLSELIKWDS